MKKELLTIGELAQLMGTTVRTLQYYHREGLLKPSSFSEGGRRLYSSKDVVKLHQILSFKYLGFSLEEIKNKIFTLDTPEEVSLALNHQKEAIKEQIESLEEALQTITSLEHEVKIHKTVDFSMYAEIIELLRCGYEGYWVWPHFDKTLQNHINNRFGKNTEAGLEVYNTYNEVLEEAIILKKQGESPKSKKSLALAKKWWDMILEFTGGDMSLLPKLEDFNNTKENWKDNKLAEKQAEIDDYLDKALHFYLSKSGSHPTQ